MVPHSVAHGQVVSVPLGGWLEIQTLRSYPRPMESVLVFQPDPWVICLHAKGFLKICIYLFGSTVDACKLLVAACGI